MENSDAKIRELQEKINKLKLKINQQGLELKKRTNKSENYALRTGNLKIF